MGFSGLEGCRDVYVWVYGFGREKDVGSRLRGLDEDCRLSGVGVSVLGFGF